MQDSGNIITLYPVVLAVPDEGRSLSGRDRVAYLSRYARRALEISAKKSGVKVTSFLKDSDGIPQPVDGNYWSITHKPEYVGAVLAPKKIGIDIEKFRTFSKGLFKKTADESEWRLEDEDPDTLFFRYWTSKEAILKAAGTGVKDLLRCRIVKIISETKLIANYMDKDWMIDHLFFNGHIASVVENSCRVSWSLLKD
ncbi:MAG: 4'-phosphopantetheinyl transferase superfamily protein [Deltaproteobacteria bacterium]|nr:4'-phosphopantetheinyl transferase superfamily protein [Deltaproteobacteria bacterium]